MKGGVCADQFNGFLCACKSGFSGPHCEIGFGMLTPVIKHFLFADLALLWMLVNLLTIYTFRLSCLPRIMNNFTEEMKEKTIRIIVAEK